MTPDLHDMTPRSSSDVDGSIRSFDGVEIAYSARGSGDTCLMFIHGGMADRTFWAPQLSLLADRYRMAAIDLAGHGESGRERQHTTIPAFAEDVGAVVQALDLRKMVLVGNSLGGPVALEAARLLAGRVIGVVGVDTLHNLAVKFDATHARQRADAFRSDFEGCCKAMGDQLFHPGAHAELRSWAVARMSATPRDVVIRMMEGLNGYDFNQSARSAGVPIRVINGDLWPTNIEANRTIVPDFDAVIMASAGHYPMLERPDEFNRLLGELIGELRSSTEEAV
jgi:pimeloyl-ACP methyl ester carboxylesterase